MRQWMILSLMVVLAARAEAVDEMVYERQIKPLLAQKCGACHGVLKQQAGLRLDAGVLIHEGGESGQVVIPGNAADSLLVNRVSASDSDERMPPEGEGEQLNATQIALLVEWINAGAVVPQDETIPADPRQHWAYQLPQRPPLPLEKSDIENGAGHNPIDAFVGRERQRLGLTVVRRAERYTLLRRLYLDLVGVPPTREQMQVFVQDDSPGAWPDVVDSLLNDPRYGERWGRHWMDVWRYSDWDGYKQQVRGSQRHIWRWRDWIIESLNADKGYDQMIVEMLAGDEVAPHDRSVLAATGFLARNFHGNNRNLSLDATVEHTAKAFLGMTLNCARCHDHKFDPIAQTSYYQFRAIFEPHSIRIDQLPGQADLLKDGLPRAFDAELTAETFLFLRGNDKSPDKAQNIVPAVPQVLGGRFDVQPTQLPIEAYYPWLQDFFEQEQRTAVRKQLADAEQAVTVDQTKDSSPNSQLLELKRQVAELRLKSLEARLVAERAKYGNTDDACQKQRLALTAAAVERKFGVGRAELAVQQSQTALSNAEATKQPKKKQLAVNAAKKALAAAVKKLESAQAAVKKTDGAYSPLGKEYPRTSTGRRLALARWIAAKDNPLTARVAVNQIWMRHFGDPLVDNVFDFGLRSPKPRHADLLDWLAVELMEHGWSMKHIHRLIVTSQTWQLASSQPPAVKENNSATKSSHEIDPDNHYLWRMNVRRMDAEIVRDSVLAVTEQLDGAQGGPDIDFRQGEVSRRRSIYIRHAYEKQMTMLVTFDAASPNECYRRSESVIRTTRQSKREFVLTSWHSVCRPLYPKS